MSYALLGIAVLFNVAAYAVFKAISTREHTLLWAGLFSVGLLLGAVNTFSFAAALRHINLAIAYPIFAGTSIALVVAMSASGFGEHLSRVHLAGAAFVVVGIALLTR